MFLPRIPHLIDLRLSEDILIWTVHFYKWVFNNFGKENNHINLAGISFGGVIVLKSCLDPFLLKNKPDVIINSGPLRPLLAIDALFPNFGNWFARITGITSFCRNRAELKE